MNITTWRHQIQANREIYLSTEKLVKASSESLTKKEQQNFAKTKQRTINGNVIAIV